MGMYDDVLVLQVVPIPDYNIKLWACAVEK